MKLHEISHNDVVRYSTIGLLKLRRLCVKFIVSKKRYCSYFCSFSCPAGGNRQDERPLWCPQGLIRALEPLGSSDPTDLTLF